METSIIVNEINEINEINEDNLNFKFEKLKVLRNKIEKLPQEQHSEILKLIANDNQLNFTENKSGTFVNLSDASSDTLKQLDDYIVHLEHQEETLSDLMVMQEQCESYL